MAKKKKPVHNTNMWLISIVAIVAIVAVVMLLQKPATEVPVVVEEEAAVAEEFVEEVELEEEELEAEGGDLAGEASGFHYTIGYYTSSSFKGYATLQISNVENPKMTRDSDWSSVLTKGRRKYANRDLGKNKVMRMCVPSKLSSADVICKVGYKHYRTDSGWSKDVDWRDWKATLPKSGSLERGDLVVCAVDNWNPPLNKYKLYVTCQKRGATAYAVGEKTAEARYFRKTESCNYGMAGYASCP